MHSQFDNAPNQDDTDAPIVALASGPLPSAIAILRLSGAECFERLSVFLPKVDLLTLEAKKAHLVSFIDPVSKTLIDKPILIKFVGPKSYTGEDLCEIFCHGSPYIVQLMLERLTSFGFRHANPGEFTQKAYLNNKMDLTEAEGIQQLVLASTKHQWQAAQSLVTGRLKNFVEDLRAQLLQSLALVEAYMDFPDEDELSKTDRQKLKSQVEELTKSTNTLLETYDRGKVASFGLRVAFVGLPNCGKSTLLNALLGYNRAIVSSIKGTTRDYISEPCQIEGRAFVFLDTAGIRETEDEIESEGIKKSVELLNSADLVLALFSTDQTPEEKTELLDCLLKQNPKKVLKVLTKIDLDKSIDEKKWDLSFSAKDPLSLQSLRKILVKEVDEKCANLEDEFFITSIRHKKALEEALLWLHSFLEKVDYENEDLLAFDLRQAANGLSEITGNISNDEVLGAIFSQFCVGK